MDPEELPQDFNLVFKGVDGAEAESFISSVQWKARTEGRIRDNEWIADLVSTCMKGEALRWYVDLDENTQNDWKLLRKAILQQYPSRTQLPAPSLQPTVPTPAAAAAPPDALNTTYRVRLYFSNTKSKYFLSINVGNPRIYVTSSDTKAIKLRWDRGNELRLENGLETQRMVGLIWASHGSNLRPSPISETDLALLLVSDSMRHVPHIPGYTGSTQVVSWTLNQDDCLESCSYLNQTQYQHQFFIERGGADGSVVQFCLSPGLKGFGVAADRVFTMKLEPV